jgi:hypothetical protein
MGQVTGQVFPQGKALAEKVTKMDMKTTARAASTPALTPDIDASIDFLKKVYPEGPWLLLAIKQSRQGNPTPAIFFPTTEAECRAWLAEHGGKQNLYWSVNPPLQNAAKKAANADIKEVRYLHVDIDPRAGEDLQSERARIKAALLTPKAGVPLPSFVVFSGGGFQAFWTLETPIPINGNEALAEDAKLYNMQLEHLYGGDNCHDISRVMRLPGTINVPDAGKLKKGRQAELATLVPGSDAVYPIEQFTKAKPARRAASDGPGNPVKVDTASVERIADLSALKDVPDPVKILIAQGKDPDEPNKYPSRSEAVFAVTCALVRANVPDEVIFSLLTDPQWAISESILEKVGNAESYAIRQIERAKDAAIHPMLAEMNEKHFVIANLGGKPAVCEWKTTDHIEALSTMAFKPFAERYCHKRVQDGTTKDGLPVYKALGAWWLSQEKRREYEDMVLDPTKPEVFDGHYNLWRGYGVKPKQGDWSLTKAHIEKVLANSNKEHTEYILRWAAWAVQNPAKPCEVALVFRGGEGVGKGIFARALKELFGRNGKQVFSSMHLTGKFNSHLRDCCLLFADEAVVPDDDKGTSVLKGLITEPTIAIEGKGRDVEWVANHVKVVMASNAEYVVPAGKDARRFVVLDVPKTYQRSKDYFTALDAELKNGGREAMLFDLLAYPLGNWHPREFIETQALRDQKLRGLKGAERLLAEILENGEFPMAKTEQTQGLRKNGFVTTSELAQYAYEWFNEKVSPKGVANVFRKIGFTLIEGDYNYWRPCPLPEARELFCQTILRIRFDERTAWTGLGNKSPKTRMINSLSKDIPF